MPADNATLFPTDKFIKPEANPSILKQTSVHIYIYIYIYIYIFVFGVKAPQWAMASSFPRLLDHTQRRTTVGRTPLDE